MHFVVIMALMAIIITSSLSKDPFTLLKHLLSEAGALGLENVELYEPSTTYRGLSASKQFQPNETIFVTPALITEDILNQSVMVRQLLQGLPNLVIDDQSTVILFSLFLLEQRTSPHNSLLEIYIKLLPESFETIPINYSEDVVSLLKGSHAYQHLKREKHNIKVNYERLIQLYPPLSSISYEELLWGQLACISRSYGLAISTQSTTRAMIPLADLINSAQDPNTKWIYNVSQRTFSVQALTFIDVGEELLMSYGNTKTQVQQFYNYGFVDLNQFNLEVLVEFCTEERDKILFLGTECTTKSFTNKTTLEQIVEFSQIISDLRFFTVHEQEIFESWTEQYWIHQRRNQVWLPSLPPTSYEEEVEVLNFILRTLRNQLEAQVQVDQSQIELENDLSKRTVLTYLFLEQKVDHDKLLQLLRTLIQEFTFLLEVLHLESHELPKLFYDLGEHHPYSTKFSQYFEILIDLLECKQHGILYQDLQDLRNIDDL